MRRSASAILVAGIVAVALAVTGCGGDDRAAPQPSAPPTAGSSSPVPSDQPTSGQPTPGGGATPSGSPSGGPALPPACAVLPPAEFAQVVGNPVFAAEGSGPGVCSYDVDRISGINGTVSITQGGDPVMCDLTAAEAAGVRRINGLAQFAVVQTNLTNTELGSGPLAKSVVVACQDNLTVVMTLYGHREEADIRQRAMDLTALTLRSLGVPGSTGSPSPSASPSPTG
ncbi:MAG: hypothetical protein L0Y54_18790 [Sporichthyaceae bacterium]|nr:hypothetical protein [Sporichthyaceae bacterium]